MQGKDQKKHQQSLLSRLGGRAASAPRMSAKIGIGLAKSKAKKAARAREEAIAEGMLQVKGSGKRGEKGNGQGRRKDKGLGEAKMKNGVLKVKQPPMKRRGR